VGTPVLILAHRGAHDPETAGVRENTLAAFAAAARLGADGVEFDVRRTADGALVVHHDAAVGGAGPIADTIRADLPDWLPTLDAALDACAALALVDVEVKDSPFEPGFDPGPGLAREVAAAVTASPVAGRVIVTSFHLPTVDAARAARPGLATGWLTVPGYDAIEALAAVTQRGHAALAPPDGAVTAEVVDAARAAGVQVIVWTVDAPERIQELAAWGVDACVTNWPGRAVSLVG
jgi:glycerophosphoryl diester phosphodiesterase